MHVTSRGPRAPRPALLLLCTLALAGCASEPPLDAGSRPHTVTAEMAQELLAVGNERFVSGKVASKDLLAVQGATAEESRRPMAVVVTCSEPDVAPEIVFDADLGDLLVVRTPCGGVDQAALGGIEYGVERYGTPLVVVLGHTSTVREDGEEDAALTRRTAIQHAFRIADTLRDSATVMEAQAFHGLKVIVALYDLDSGTVEWYEDGGCELGSPGGGWSPGQDDATMPMQD